MEATRREISPFQEIRNHEIGSPGDKGLGLSWVEIPEQLWTVRFKELTCREITRFGKSGIGDSRIPHEGASLHVSQPASQTHQAHEFKDEQRPIPHLNLN